MLFQPARLLALAVLALAVTVAPADAKKRKPQDENAANAAQSKSVKKQRGNQLFPPGPVYHANEYLGDDPDPFIRSQLMRDLGAHYGPPD